MINLYVGDYIISSHGKLKRQMNEASVSLKKPVFIELLSKRSVKTDKSPHDTYREHPDALNINFHPCVIISVDLVKRRFAEESKLHVLFLKLTINE